MAKFPAARVAWTLDGNIEAAWPAYVQGMSTPFTYARRVVMDPRTADVIEHNIPKNSAEYKFLWCAARQYRTI